MSKIIQYISFEKEAVDYLWKYWFSYELKNTDLWVTSINRMRKFLSDAFNISAISKNLIFGLINESWWQILWDGIDTNANTCTLIFVNITSFKKRVTRALKDGEIRNY